MFRHCNWKNSLNVPAHLFVFVMLTFPLVNALFYVRIVLLSVVLLIVMALVLKTGRLGLHPTIILWTYSLTALSFLFILEGCFTGAPGAFKTVSVYVIFPSIYAVMIAGVRNERILTGVIATFVFSTICISIYAVTHLLIQTGLMPENKFFDLISFDWELQAFDIHDKYIGMQYPGLKSLPFLVPFTLSASVIPTTLGSSVPLFLRRAWLWIATLLSLLAVMISGRRALYFVTLIAPCLIFLFSSFQPKSERRVSRRALVQVTAAGLLTVLIVLIVLNVLFGVTVTGLEDRFLGGFNFSATADDSSGAIERATQYRALLAGWMENPLFGAGHGAPVYGSIRSDTEPWTYELTYLALLYQTGLFGFTAYSAGVLWIYWMGLRVIRAGGQLSGLMVASLVGMSSILIANATNPYVAGLDGMWGIFLPLAVINLWFAAPKKLEKIQHAVNSVMVPS